MQLAARLGASMAMLAAAAAVQGVVGVTPIATLYVDQRAPEGGNGESWQGAFRDLQDALNKATTIVPQGPTWKERLIEVRIAQGTYKPAGAGGDRDRCFGVLTSAPVLSLRGAFAGLGATDPDAQDFVSTATVLSGDLNGDDGAGWTNRGDNSRTILRIETQMRGFLEIEGLTFEGAENTGMGWGSAVRLAVTNAFDAGPSECRINECVFTDNQTDGDGAGLLCWADSLTLINSRFLRNRSLHGKGGAASINGYESRFSNIENCLFQDNSAKYGGALFLGGRAWVFASRFFGNSAAVFGGGVYVTEDVDLNSVLLVGNSAAAAGGGVFSGGSAMLGISMTTFDGSMAPNGADVGSAFAPVRMFASILWGSRFAPGGSAIDLGYGVFDSWISGVIIQRGEDAIAYVPGTLTFESPVVSEDPEFIRPAEAADEPALWDYRPRRGSPATGLARNMNGLLQDLGGVNFGCELAVSDRFDAGCYFIDSCVCWANLNADWDGLVNDEDFELFVEAYNTMMTPAALPRADLDRNGLVDDADFSLFAAAYDALLCD